MKGDDLKTNDNPGPVNPEKRDHCQPFWFWLDLEMTGLDPVADRILEAAAVVTNPAMEVLQEWSGAVRQPPSVLAGMNDWCQKHHAESGLLARVPEGVGEDDADRELVRLTAGWGDVPVVLCGNSIGQDRKFVDRYLPRFAARLHYRMLDVSSFKVVFQNLYGKHFEKRNTHLALDDIRESIAELRYYLRFVNTQST